MRFTRGNSGNLKGKGSIYLELEGDFEGFPKYPALYISANPDDFIFPEMDFKILKKVLEVKEQEYGDGIVDKSPKGIIPFFATKIDVENVSELEKFAGDIFYAGKILSNEIFFPILASLSRVYMFNYGSQILRNGGALEDILKIDEFKQYDGDGIIKRLYNLTDEFFYSHQVEDEIAKDDIRKDLLGVGRNSPFSEQISDIVRILYEKVPNQEILLDLNIQLAGAIRDEDYLEISHIRKKIENIEKNGN